MSRVQRKAARDIINCRTASLGAHIDTCDNCGHMRISYNSCRNRHCPKCQSFAKEKWIDKQRKNLLNTPYFHVVFTVPSELNPIFRQQQSAMYALLFQAASETVLELCADRKYLGAMPGITAILHTWGQNLQFHPHIHMIVTGGGLTPDQTWRASSKHFFLPVRVLSAKFRGKFLALLRTRFPAIDKNLLNTCYRKNGWSIASHLLITRVWWFPIWAGIPIVLRFPTTEFSRWNTEWLRSAGGITPMAIRKS